MSATVARTGSFRPEATTGRLTVRVTHALLFLAAAAVPPGVCDACPACPTRAERSDSPDGSQDRPAGSRQQGVAAAVAASHCCGPRASPVPCVPTGRSPADRMPPRSVADAGDGAPSCCAAGCTCLLEPRDGQPDAIAAAAAGLSHDLGVALPPGGLPTLTTAQAATRIERLSDVRPPSRPVRVLYGVWRN